MRLSQLGTGAESEGRLRMPFFQFASGGTQYFGLETYDIDGV